MALFNRVIALLLLFTLTGCAYVSGIDLPELAEIDHIRVRYSEHPNNVEHNIDDQSTIARVLLLLAEVNNGWRQPLLTPMPGYTGSAGLVNHSGETVFVLWFSENRKGEWWLGSADRTKEGGITYIRNRRDDITKELSQLLISEEK